MTAKRWTISLLLALAVTLVGLAATMRVLDPLLRYGTESSLLTYYEYDELYSNPGIARHYSYDTVLVGTSMIENTNVDVFDAEIGCAAVRLPYSGASAYNVRRILDICFESGNDIEAVYWELGTFELFAEPSTPRYPLPEYLYRDDATEDLSYLLNLDIFYQYVARDIVMTARGQIQPAARRGLTLFGTYDAELVVEYYDRPEIGEPTEYGPVGFERTQANVAANIVPLVEGHPETRFVFYFAPYSILFWDQEIRNGAFDVDIASIEYATGELLRHDNVEVYFFWNETDICTDLDNYKDKMHYGDWINNYLTRQMAAGENRLTLDTYLQEIEAFREFALAYDYEAIFE